MAEVIGDTSICLEMASGGLLFLATALVWYSGFGLDLESRDVYYSMRRRMSITYYVEGLGL